MFSEIHEVSTARPIDSAIKKLKRKELRFLYTYLDDLGVGSLKAKETLREIERLEAEIATMA